MKRLPIDLNLVTKTTKVSAAAWDRAQELKQKHDVRLSDIVSACLLYMPEDLLEKIVKEQTEVLDNLPKPIIGLLRNVDKLSDDEIEMIRSILPD
ncbi:MAG: hypothetical protein VX309_00300 [Pseudomonadota bacterium]|nr:hypothetical protein [Pseudomonadota bacterium]